MLFNSQEFLFLFLPVTAVIFAGSISHLGRQVFVLLVSSLTFYAYWHPPMVLLLVCSITVNWLFACCLERFRNRKRLVLSVAIAGNLTVLALFKYDTFLAYNFGALFGLSFFGFEWVLPLGISFFTFQQIAFLVDLSRQEINRPPFLQYATFVSFFPQLIAGPIVRYADLGPQLSFTRSANVVWRMAACGMVFFVIGLAKKILIADEISRFVDQIFLDAGMHHIMAPEAWLAAIGFTLQIYFDFSAYSDMAVGLAMLFGVRLPHNFQAPLKAASIIEFWRRWHITLSQFLRDYLYIPIGGNQFGIGRQAVAISVTMLLGGLWHGASWNFVIWGGLHGAAIVCNHYYLRAGFHMPRIFAWLLTFLFVVVAFVIFRAPDFATAGSILMSMVNISELAMLPSVSIAPGWRPAIFNNYALDAISLVVGGLVIALLCPRSDVLLEKLTKPNTLWAILTALGAVLLSLRLGGQSANEFIYFLF